MIEHRLYTFVDGDPILVGTLSKEEYKSIEWDWIKQHDELLDEAFELKSVAGLAYQLSMNCSWDMTDAEIQEVVDRRDELMKKSDELLDKAMMLKQAGQRVMLYSESQPQLPERQ